MHPEKIDMSLTKGKKQIKRRVVFHESFLGDYGAMHFSGGYASFFGGDYLSPLPREKGCNFINFDQHIIGHAVQTG